MELSRLIALIACSAGIADAAKPLIVSASVENGEIVVSGVKGAKPRQLTNDGLRKSLVVLSPLGDRIAYITDTTDGSGALATVKVIPASGGIARAIPFRVPNPDVPVSGMRFVEELLWIDENRLALVGSVNPSTVEYAVIAVDSGKEVDWYGTDGFSLAVSPFGKHVACESWVSHFQTEEERRPRLCLDHECEVDRSPWTSYPSEGRHVEFLSNPVWAPDGSAVASLARDYKTSKLSLAVRPLDLAATEYPLPEGLPAGPHQVVWDGEGVLVNNTWRLRPGKKSLTQVR